MKYSISILVILSSLIHFNFTSCQSVSNPNIEKNQRLLHVSNSDTIILKGKITEDKIPFPKANVKLNGTEIQTQSDFDGTFIIKIPPASQLSGITLTVSYVGMITKEVTVRNLKRKINIQIVPEHVIIE